MSEPTPFPSSLCHQCAHQRLVKGARSTFLQCTSPQLAQRYVPQPVRRCSAFAGVAATPTPSEGPETADEA